MRRKGGNTVLLQRLASIRCLPRSRDSSFCTDAWQRDRAVGGQAPEPESFELRPPVPVPDFATLGKSRLRRCNSGVPLDEFSAALWTCEERSVAFA